MKRILSFVLALVMLIGLMPMETLATENEANPWEGRSAVFVGDSITAGSGTTKIYYEYLKESLGFGSVTPMGVAGSCISAASDYGQSNQPLISRYQNIPSADLIVIFMGTNDYGHETPLGNVEDTQDGTFYGALNVIIPALVAKHTSSKIVFVTPLHRNGFGTSKILGTKFTSDDVANGVGATLGEYVDALKTVCANNGVSVIDLYTECTLDPADAETRTNYMPDGLHPNAAGHEVVAGIMESHIRGFAPAEQEPVEQNEMVYGNRFAPGNNQTCRASSRINYYLKAGTVITLKDPAAMQWACTKTSDETSSSNLGYFPDSAWSDKDTAVVAADGWVGFVFKYRDETQVFNLTKPLSDYTIIEEPHTHTYQNGICTGCGEAHPNFANYKGKVISILGDSISTFAGYIPTADGFNLAHKTRYPQDNLLTDVNETWWMQVIKALDAKLGINESWASSEVYNYIDEEVNSTSDGTKACMASLTRIQNLGSNGTPDVILFFGGTNDITQSRPVGTFDPATAPTEVDLLSVKWDTVADAYVDAIMRMQHYYPDAQIVAMLPFYRNSQGTAKVDQYNSLFAAICEHYGVTYVDLRYCGITNANLPDGTHPEANGMDYITDAVMEVLTAECKVTAGEHIVHSVTHNLNGATSSLGYYKGISHRTSFTTTITGDDIMVTVTMGGVDITADCYTNGVVSIDCVTGDLVIAVEGRPKTVYADYLQELPDDLCFNTNLWTTLKPINLYYRASSGWGLNATGLAHSITFPVSAGDQIWATSFQESGINGGTKNGIALTWFDAEGVIKTFTPEQTYAEFAKNGYLTAPEGAVAVNVVMWNGDTNSEVYILNRDHCYENGICTGCGATVSPYLQQLPENITGCTNLYDSLVPVKGYYTATKYDTSNGAVLSVVIPVEPGDRIAASSFGAVSENMGSVNGIRVTYLQGDKIVASLSASEVYNRYTSDHYLTVPDGVDAVCVPWWIPSDSNWLTLSQLSKDFVAHSPKPVPAQAPTCTENGYTAGEICEVCNVSLGEREAIPPTGHTYSADTCTSCGAVNLLALLGGKYVSVLGDSISTFNGYSNDATGNTTIGGNGPRYDAGAADTKPGSYCLLESVDDTWWMHFANRSGMNLLVNNSWAGSQVFGGKTSDGRVIPAAYLDRCVNLHDNTLENNPGNAPIHPDVIFVYLGINDYNFNRSKVGTAAVDYAGLVNSDGTYVTPTTFGEAYGIMLHKMHEAYPDAQIFAMTLLPENLYSVDKTAWEQHNACIRAAAEYYDIPLVDLAENCAITWENFSSYMIDKIHPTTAGMKLISDCIAAELSSYFKENPPHTHTYTPTVTAPTCTEQGYTTYTCACGDSYVADYTDELGYYHATAEQLSDGESLILSDFNVLKHNKAMIFRADVENLGDGVIRLSHGKDAYNGSHLEITGDSLIVYKTSSSVSTKTYSHGLRIEGTVKVRIDVGRSNATVTIITESGTYSKSVSWLGCNGALDCAVTGAVLKNVDLRWYATGITSDYWFFGDSWFNTTSSARWTSYLLDDGYDVLLAGYPGMGAPAGLNQFRSLLELDMPKYAVWALGMNNGDRNGKINASWLSATEEFLALCQQHDITPILCTIPTTPKVNNRLKNSWVENSGYRYIDFDLSVVQNHTTGEWFEGMAATDLNHPTALGAQALYPQVFADFPELAQADSATCQHKLHLLAARTPECEYGGRAEYYVCSLCAGTYADAQAVTKVTGDEMKRAPSSHSYGAWTETASPGCTTAGSERRECTNCSRFETKETAATGHTEVTDRAIAPTCTETGLTEGKHCSVCDAVLVKQEVVPATGHTVVTDHAIAPTCTETGLTEGKHCSVCDEVLVKQEVVPATGHTEVVDKAIAPTCTETGLTEGKHCSVCDAVLVKQEVVPATGHTVVTDRTIAPTCTETGLTEGKHCSVCDEVLVKQEVVPATGHTEVTDRAIAPTCTETGLTEGKHCAVCDEVLVKQEVVPATGHSYENGTCTDCGAADPDYVPLTVEAATSIAYTVSGNTVTVTHDAACKVGYLENGAYVRIDAIANGDGSYRFEVPAGITNVLLVVNGDVNGDGKITGVDKGQLNAAVLGKVTLSAEGLFGADVSNDGRLTGVDKGQLNAVILGKTAFGW